VTDEQSSEALRLEAILKRLRVVSQDMARIMRDVDKLQAECQKRQVANNGDGAPVRHAQTN
jgi:hypothetical protein